MTFFSYLSWKSNPYPWDSCLILSCWYDWCPMHSHTPLLSYQHWPTRDEITPLDDAVTVCPRTLVRILFYLAFSAKLINYEENTQKHHAESLDFQFRITLELLNEKLLPVSYYSAKQEILNGAWITGILLDNQNAPFLWGTFSSTFEKNAQNKQHSPQRSWTSPGSWTVEELLSLLVFVWSPKITRWPR